MKRYLGPIFLSLCALGLSAARANAAVPLTFTQQGRLSNTDGTAAAGPVRMIFAIYDSSSSTTPLWTETQSNVALDNGAFSVQLGAVTAFPSTLWTGATLYLGVTIGNDAEMTPREQITSVPYALLCANADHATNADNATVATTATSATQLGGVAAASYQRALLTPDCGPGNYVQKIDTAGNVTCVADLDSGGTVSAVSASNGLTGSISGGTLSIGRSFTFNIVTGSGSGTASFFADATCATNSTLVSGGCKVSDINSVLIAESYPNGNGWHCTCRDSLSTTVSCTAYARCLVN